MRNEVNIDDSSEMNMRSRPMMDEEGDVKAMVRMVDEGRKRRMVPCHTHRCTKCIGLAILIQLTEVYWKLFCRKETSNEMLAYVSVSQEVHCSVS